MIMMLTHPFCLSSRFSWLAPLVASVAMLASAPATAAEPAKTALPDAAKGQTIATQVCAACHTSDGSRGSPANPILAGQHPEYLAKQLNEFKSGKRKNAVMAGFASTLSAADIANVSAFYASKTAKPGFAKQKDTLALGEKLWRAGSTERSLPACAGCHAPTGAGIPSQYPRLSGQHSDYTEAQLVAFRAGTRANNPVMTAIAAKMSDKEIKAVSDYAAGLR